MADNTNYEVPFRRRREQKTDYKQRRNLLKSGKPRAVVRLSNNHTRVHIAHYNRDGDKNTAQTVSKELEDHGWEYHTGNLPATYLTGYLAGMKADVDEAVLDLGIKETKKGGKMFAALQGLKDAGIEIPAGEEVIPEKSRIRGEHIKEMTGNNVPENFETVKKNIEGELE
ncbi:MAG: 50S ribosomal protein L18 [Nanohaloarchaea archaeon SW_4_43_9]|nr:ribosomal protein L18 [uncultured archaeon]PSH00285.1 MAG: 50S ribosomal protein L18 [Nanohaloarchaea archaeon SW_4_43_9]